MDLHDSDAFVFSYLSKKPHMDERNPKPYPQDQPGMVVDLLSRGFGRIRGNTQNDDPLQISKFDGDLGEHLKKHQGWNESAKADWLAQGKSVDAASGRIASLGKMGFLNRKELPTPAFDRALVVLNERHLARSQKRFALIHRSKEKQIWEVTKSLNLNQKALIHTLAEFRQCTPYQSRKMGVSAQELTHLQKSGLIEKQRTLCDGKLIELLTLSSKKSPVSGKEVAKTGLGIASPFAGIQRDQAKILHDVSVVDAVFHARDRFEKKGYTFLGAVSEHRLYGQKSCANSDLGCKYADAYLVFQRPGSDDTCTIAVEFGNYPPGYLKEKCDGIKADQILVYTHDERRAEEYAKVFQNSDVEIHVIPAPHFQEQER